MSKNTNLSFLTDYITADITNGRIGINNVSPTVAFDVIGATKITGVLTLTSTISNGNNTYTLPSATGTLALTSAISGTTNYIPKFTSSTAIGNSLIYDDGTNIGVGTTTPNQLLSLRKTSAGAETIALALQNIGSTAGTAVSMIFCPHESSTTPEPLAKISAIRTAQSGAPTDLAFYTYNTGLSERMRILANGNVGIGTSAPTNKLEVNGTGYFNGSLGSGGTISGGGISTSGTVQGATLITNSAIYTYNVQQWYYGNTFTFTPPNALNSGSVNSEMRIYLVWIIGVNGATEAGLRVWLIAMNGGGTAYNANELLGRDANGATGLNIYRSSASQISINSNNNAYIKFVSIMQLNTF